MRHIPPPVWVLFSVLLMAALHFKFPIRQLARWPVTLVGCGLIAMSLILFVWAVRQFLVEKTTVIPFHESTALMTSGPFCWTRNPIYLSMLLSLAGVAVLFGSLTPWFVVPLFWLVINRLFIRKEEVMLQDTFGNDYQQYCSKVPRWLWRI